MTRTPMVRLLWLIRAVLESLGNSSDSSRKQILGIFRDTLRKFSYFIMKLYVVQCMYPLESPDSHEYTQHTAGLSGSV